MARLAWCTDIHLDVCGDTDNATIRLVEKAVRQGVDGMVVTGDISNGQNLVYHLSVMERVLQKPIYFVLGNHDYWAQHRDNIHKQMRELNGMAPYLKWLPGSSYVPISDTTCILGHDGWYDCFEGDFKTSPFTMNDWNNIHDFREIGGPANRSAIVALSRKWSHEATKSVHDAIKSAARYHSVIVVATHVPPFVEVAKDPEGRTNVDSLPWYTSSLMGSMLRQAAQAFPKVKFVVLAGHTHKRFSTRIDGNMVCHVGGADYGRPELQDIVEVP